MQRVHIKLFIIFLILLGLSIESPAQNDCSSLFNQENTKSSLETLEKKLNTKLRVFIFLDNDLDDIQDYSIRIKDDKEVYSIALFSFHEKTKILEVIQMKTYGNYQRLGLGSFMMEEMIKQLPQTEIIWAKGLSDSNTEIVNRYLAKGYSHIRALKETPAYKIRAKLGFTEIIPESIGLRDRFSVKKPTP